MKRLFICGFWFTLMVANSLAAVQIVEPIFREYEDGPPVARNAAHLPGDTVYLTFQIAGFKVEGEERKVHLKYSFEARDPEGLPITEPKKGEVKVELAHEDKDWQPKIRVEAPIPDPAPGGTYHLLLAIDDEYGKTEAKQEIPFLVKGRTEPNPPQITAEHIEFLRHEDDTAPLSRPPVYHPGDTLWVRFTFAGYHFGPQNKFHIQYGLAMKSSEGKVMFTQPTAADLEEKGFYPKRYVPAVFNLRLDKTIQPGEYVVLLIVRDLVSGDTVEYPETFRVE